MNSSVTHHHHLQFRYTQPSSSVIQRSLTKVSDYDDDDSKFLPFDPKGLTDTPDDEILIVR